MIYIFEGIASSGKTTMEKLLAQQLPDAALVTEGTTLMPIVENSDKAVAKSFLKKQLDGIRESRAHDVIIDRFHFTHAFRTRSKIEDFWDIEDELRKIGKVAVVLLVMDPGQIGERIEETALHRRDNWKKGKQGSIEEKVEYYSKQQEILKSYVGSSRLPVIEIDTSAEDWTKYVDEILNMVQVRKASVEDIDTLEDFQKHLHGEWFEDSRSDLKQAIASGHVWLAIRGDEAIGYQLCELFGSEHRNFPDSIFLSELYVVPNFRDKGVGTKLVRQALSEPWPKGYGYFSLTHDPDEPLLTKYYEKFGFKECGMTAVGNVKMTRVR